MTYLDDYINYGEISGLNARSQSLNEADQYVQPRDFEGPLFHDYKVTQSKYYERAVVDYQGISELINNYADDLIYSRIWATQEIDFGYILEDKSQEVYIWNAYKTEQKSITAFTDPAHSGIAIDAVTVPTVLDPNEEISYTVTVYAIGPAEQNTIYEWTVAGADFETLVTGKRVIPFPFPANWGAGVNIGYGFNTVIYKAPTTHEQRRSLHNKVRRTSNFEVILSRMNAQKFNNMYRLGAARFFGVPIQSEVMTTSDSPILGSFSITANEDLVNFFNLQTYCNQVMLVNHETAMAEMKILTSIVGQTLNFEIAVANDFPTVGTVIYPIYIGMLEQADFKFENDGVLTANVSFRESFIG